MVIVNSTIDTLRKKYTVRDRTDRAWFSRLLRYPARKRSGSILTTPEPARGRQLDQVAVVTTSPKLRQLLHGDGDMGIPTDSA